MVYSGVRQTYPGCASTLLLLSALISFLSLKYSCLYCELLTLDNTQLRYWLLSEGQQFYVFQFIEDSAATFFLSPNSSTCYGLNLQVLIFLATWGQQKHPEHKNN